MRSADASTTTNHARYGLTFHWDRVPQLMERYGLRRPAVGRSADKCPAAANTAAKPLDNADPVRTLWKVGPAHGPQWTVLDDVPTPTDQMVPEAVACPLRARSAGQRREITVTPGQPDTPADLWTGRLTRCANRPSKQRVVQPRVQPKGRTSPDEGEQSRTRPAAHRLSSQGASAIL
jgi:hypothetical protein